MTAVTLHRIDPTHNMARFYVLDVQPDLFGCILLVKAWGRIGGRGRVVHELHRPRRKPAPPCSARPSASGGAGISEVRGDPAARQRWRNARLDCPQLQC